jgi:NAD(P)-dependent dehydrogenase (short-subunit alcohol dehydrogenase family)
VADTHSVATPEGGAAIVQSAIDAFERIDIVINNAGILRDKTFRNMTPEMVDAVIDVHLKGAFNVTQPAWGHMREQGYGRILNTSSNSGLLGNFGQANYGAAKMGLVGLTRVLAAEGARYNIKVNALAPLAWTRMTEDVFGESMGDRFRPELVSPVACFLVHEDCPVSGEIFSAAGGRVARFFIGMTEGYFNPELSAEDVRDHFAEVRDETGYTVPADPTEEMALVAKLLAS